jgi:putative Holliday junction resolvase
MRILAVDYGEKYLGIAVGHQLLKTVTPLPRISRKTLDGDIQQLKLIISEYDIEKIIMGYPLYMDGSKSKTVKKVEHFAAILRKSFNLDVQFIDERLTSFEAEEYLKTMIPDFITRKKYIDSVSAMIILRDFLEKN